MTQSLPEEEALDQLQKELDEAERKEYYQDFLNASQNLINKPYLAVANHKKQINRARYAARKARESIPPVPKRVVAVPPKRTFWQNLFGL